MTVHKQLPDAHGPHFRARALPLMEMAMHRNLQRRLPTPAKGGGRFVRSTIGRWPTAPA